MILTLIMITLTIIILFYYCRELLLLLLLCIGIVFVISIYAIPIIIAFIISFIFILTLLQWWLEMFRNPELDPKTVFEIMQLSPRSQSHSCSWRESA